MKKILIVVESIDVNDSSGSKANVALIENLHRTGFDLRVYHYTLKEIQLPGISCILMKENRQSLLFFASRIERYLRDYLKLQLHKPLQKMFGFSFTLYNDRNSIINSLKKDENFESDLVITLSKGGSFRPHHALLKIPKWHSKWLAYIHDPYPMHHYPKPYTWFEPGFKKKEDFVKKISEKAAYSAFPSLLLLQWMGKFYPRFLQTGCVIPHQMIHLDVQGVELPEFFNQEKFILLHAGNLLGARNPKGLISAFLKFIDKVPDARDNARLIFLGGNNNRVRDVARQDLSVYASETYIKFEQVYKMQQLTSVNIIIEANAELSPFLPGKFPHCIAADKPILLLGPPVSEVRRLLGNDYLFWSEIYNEDKIAALIETLYNNWKNGLDKVEYISEKKYLSEENLKTIIDNI